MILSTHGFLASSGGVAIDADAQAFFDRVTTAGGSLTNTEKSAVNTLVIDLKANSLWTPMKAIYPMVGASAAACAQNLKSSSFTGTFTSGWTFASTGATPNGTSAYMNTGLVPSSSLSVNDTHLSYYSRTNSVGGSDIGSSNSSYRLLNFINLRFTGNVYFCHITSQTATITGSSTNSQGFYTGARTSSTLSKFYKNGSVVNSSVVGSQGLTGASIWVGGTNFVGSPEYSNRETAFASIGDGLTDTQASDFYTAVQAFQTTLSRQV
jgi:hypothetical protein